MSGITHDICCFTPMVSRNITLKKWGKILFLYMIGTPPLFDLTLAEKSVYVRLYGDQYGSFYHIPFNDTFVILSKNFSTNKAENIIQSNKTLTRDPLTSKFMGV